MFNTNFIIYWGYLLVIQCGAFFSKIVERRAKTAVTPIKMVSCAFHFGYGTEVEQDTINGK